MSVIILRPWTDERTFVVVVVLIANVPIESSVKSYGQACIWRLKTHRIRRHQKTRSTKWICNSGTLTVVFVYAVGDIDRGTWGQLGDCVDVEEVVPHVVETPTLRMTHSIKEVLNDSIAIYPVVVITSVNREPRIGRPVDH